MEKIGKKPVALLKEAPGFVGNRLQFALLREALYCVQEGIATAEAVDLICKYSIVRRLGVTGPLETADLGGLDIFYNISAYLNADLADDKEGSAVMKKCVDEGKTWVQKQGLVYTSGNRKNWIISRRPEKKF